MLNTDIKDALTFIWILLASMIKSYLKNTHELLSSKLCEIPADFLFSIYYHQAIDLIEYKTCKSLPVHPKTKRPGNVLHIF